MRWRRFFVGALIGFLIIYMLRHWGLIAPEATPRLKIKGVRVDLDACCARAPRRELRTVRQPMGPAARAGDVSLVAGAVTPAGRVSDTAIDLTPPLEQPSEPEDLARLEGIGPKIRDLLNENGIFTFAQLVATSVEELRSMLSAGGGRFRIADPRTWPEQALFARDGDWEALKAFQGALKGGRPV